MIAQSTKQVHAYAYLRVSSKGQLDGGGFSRQAAEIYGYVDSSRDICVHSTFLEAYTGTESRRPALDALIAKCMEDGVRTIIVEAQCRLARELMTQLSLLKELYEEGFSVIEAATGRNLTEALFNGHPTEKLLVQIISAVAAWDRDMIVKKLRDGREHCREQTGTCEGRKPYGANDEEEQALKRMRDLVVAGQTRKQVVEQLNAEGYTTRRGLVWSDSNIRKIFTRVRRDALCV